MAEETGKKTKTTKVQVDMATELVNMTAIRDELRKENVEIRAEIAQLKARLASQFGIK